MKFQRMAWATACAMALSTGALAQSITATGVWVRATVQGQMSSGAFMTLTAKGGAKLVGVASPVAGVVEVHEMKMEGDVMKMRAVEGGIDLPAGKPVELKPGGYHVMLMDLKTPLRKDTTISMTLLFKDAKGAPGKLELKVPVLQMPPAGTSMGGHADHKM